MTSPPPADHDRHPHTKTLSMVAYADLDCSVIDELPPGRNPITTVLIDTARRQQVSDRVGAACREGRQAYWVCALIEESDALQANAAEIAAAQLSEVLTDLKVGLLHGRLSAEEKAEIMAAFAANRIDILVATTVIEVGVDVPNKHDDYRKCGAFRASAIASIAWASRPRCHREPLLVDVSITPEPNRQAASCGHAGITRRVRYRRERSEHSRTRGSAGNTTDRAVIIPSRSTSRARSASGDGANCRRGASTGRPQTGRTD